ncbi:MAG: ArsR family transcriptional regulator [Phototrophicales bacterium]|nr:MAG: ArsR family transcriptional regulator [Phototrophicales bacterium]RMG86096.1 MAG: transcriptional regulator [Chloroflexota bacterium]
MNYKKLAQKLKLLGHPVRLQILDILRNGEVCVCHIERQLNKRQAYISQHLMALRNAGIVEDHREGLNVYYRITDEEIAQLLTFLHEGRMPATFTIIEDCPCPTCSTVHS